MKKITHHGQVYFIEEMQPWYDICEPTGIRHHLNRIKEKDHVITSIDAEKAFEKYQYLFVI
jgi:hypothetical protein